MQSAMIEQTRTSPPPEWWEHLAAGPATWLADHPGAAALLRRVRAVGTWVALPVFGAMLVLVPSTRESVRAYAWSFAMLVVWFLLVRTKTVSWAGTARWFSVCVVSYFDGDRVVAVDGQSGEILDWPPDFGAIRWDAAIRRMNG